jgi:pyruvate dehydrogenase (quinone)
MGIKGIRVEHPRDLPAAVQEMLDYDGPALLDVVSARQELVMPPTITLGDVQKFGMFTMKAVLDGRAGELIDLARTNLHL